MIVIFFKLVTPANAGVMSVFNNFFGTEEIIRQKSAINSQNIPLLQSASTLAAGYGRGGGGTTVVKGSYLEAATGPLSTSPDITTPPSDQISVYVVRPGDNLSQIAEMFKVSANTIRWANDINRNDVIQTGQVLVILPISGLKYTIKEDDTLAGIAKEFKGDLSEIARFNGLETGARLTVGSEIIIPNADLHTSPVSRPAGGAVARSNSSSVGNTGGYFIRPVPAGAVRTQGIHGYNGVDLAAAHGSDIYAAAAGTVIISRAGSWNGGYGNYVVVRHDNGTQTLYAHLSANLVSQGQTVVAGQVIGRMGSTGFSTGSHLHFEVRGGTNPF
ncbi:MAG: LysM peptidoglycan-binding domain-containing M23 family metallopeptidase [Candidatus Paceibacterota bacterium]